VYKIWRIWAFMFTFSIIAQTIYRIRHETDDILNNGLSKKDLAFQQYQ
jgi:hypothetical protein